MDTIPNEFPISLRSWPAANSNDALPSIIQRINLERGGFQYITEESLRQEIAREEEELNNGDNAESSSEDEEEPDKAKELNTAREEFIGQIEQAHQASMLALDFISLLLSKDAPVQASLSLSPDLQAMIGVKTLGADKLAAPRTTDAQKQDNRNVAKGLKTQHLNKAVDSILASATRLEKEIEHETKYWEQVLAVSEKGWAVCRLPNQRHILGVRFGFSESSPAFKGRSLAALKRNADGTISLDQGLADAQPKSLRVRIEVNGTYTGSSTVPKAIPEESSVEALILQARNTIFSEELWQEMNRESRVLEPIRSKDSTLIYHLTDTRTLVLDLVILEEEPIQSKGPDDRIAEGIFLALNILLSSAHRLAHRRRTQPPAPIVLEKRATPPLNLLRPFITRVKHQEMMSKLRDVLQPLYRVLQSIQLDTPPEYTQVSTVWPAQPNLTSAERTVSTLTDRLDVIATLTVTPTTTFSIKAQTHSQPTIFPQFFVSVSPPSSPLHMTCPPPARFETLSALQDYLYYATSCALASIFVPSPHPKSSFIHGLPSPPEPNGQSRLSSPFPSTDRHPTTQWTQTASPSTLSKSLPNTSRTKQLTFTIRSSRHYPVSAHGSPTILRVQWEYARGDSSGTDLPLLFPVEGKRSELWGDGKVAGPEGFTEEEKERGVWPLTEDGGSGRGGKGEGMKRKRGLQAEGYYEWFAWVGEDDDDKGFFEVVRSLESVIESAGSVKEGEKGDE
ncbi:related to SRB4 DNA-directed RNA polymerase II holoenzyme and Kornberg`s mediator (SRB) subcomplex subunit [Rhynchosporium secalis]|uniref:Mediator of RNA polymerase II transcription subunit 17 n=1 Tax=Rhynchosporium secalis TaxID=38038 RepID=A0A1E1MNJ6_RHYSE|nr:related to SRB4 DNA-directed RNA polymerase II holoenzyme and Kornberg`s mediator (SRB) subcomplex subunit [Rhynchosporium secalis]